MRDVHISLYRITCNYAPNVHNTAQNENGLQPFDATVRTDRISANMEHLVIAQQHNGGVDWAVCDRRGVEMFFAVLTNTYGQLQHVVLVLNQI